MKTVFQMLLLVQYCYGHVVKTLNYFNITTTGSQKVLHLLYPHAMGCTHNQPLPETIHAYKMDDIRWTLRLENFGILLLIKSPLNTERAIQLAICTQ